MKRRLFALACVLSAAGWLASVAVACHSEITAGIDCSGTVTYTATAWTSSEATDISRTNTDVRVYASFDGGSTYQQVGSGQFVKQNGFTFSGSFPAGSASSVKVKVLEAAHWGNGDAPGEARYATVTKPGGCSTTPPTTPPTTTVTHPSVPAPTIALVKLERVDVGGPFVAGPLSVSVGQTVYYQMVVTNTGSSTVSVTLTDDGCDAGTFTPVGPQAILPGASFTYTCSHTIVAADGQSYMNTALATAENAGPVKATATATVVANIAAPQPVVVSAPKPTSGVLGAAKTSKTAKPAKHVLAKKKVIKRAKPARAVIRAANFTG